MRLADDGSVVTTPPERGCLTCVVVSGVLFIVALGVLAFMWPKIVSSLEFGFKDVLLVQASSQDHYKIQRIRDDDDDEQGEYLSIPDMPLLEEDDKSTTDEPTYAIPARLREKVVKDGGLMNLGAYTLVYYLPDGQGGWRRDDGTPPPEDPAAADERERAFVIYAVPAHPRWLGRHVLVVDQGRRLEDGSLERVIYFTENASVLEEGGVGYDATRLPAANAAYPPGSSALTQPLGQGAAEQSGTDGMIWRRLD